MKNKIKLILKYLDDLYSNPRTELNYNNDYELLISVVLSAQTTDKKVNKVTSVLFTKYSTLKSFVNINIDELSNIIKPLGMYQKKAEYIKDIVNDLYYKYKGKVPSNREDLESLNGVGRKTANVVLGILYNQPCIPVDTHVARVSKRLGLTNSNNPKIIEKDLIKIIPNNLLIKVHHQMVLFGRYYCKAMKPKCYNCKLREICNYNNNK